MLVRLSTLSVWPLWRSLTSPLNSWNQSPFRDVGILLGWQIGSDNDVTKDMLLRQVDGLRDLSRRARRLAENVTAEEDSAGASAAMSRSSTSAPRCSSARRSTPRPASSPSWPSDRFPDRTLQETTWYERLRSEPLLTDFPARHVREVQHLWIPLSDGTRLAARLWLPDDAEQHPVPALLEYLPYRKRDGTAERDSLTHP